MKVEQQLVDSFIDVFSSITAPVNAVDGCINCALYKDIGSSDMLFLQQWRDSALLKQHVNGQTFRKILVAMDMLCAPPEITICSPSGRKSIPSPEDLFAEKLS